MRIKQAIGWSAVWLWGAFSVSGGTIPLFENFGTLTNTPQINAVAFANHGQFSVFSPLAYDFLNTVNFTNTGTMTGFPGFQFMTVTDAGTRKGAVNFLNEFGGSITAGSGFSSFGPIFQGGFSSGGSQLFINATNVVNRGALRSGAGGLLKIVGADVDLMRSTVGIVPFQGRGAFLTETNFFPDEGIEDIYWGMNNEDDNTFNVTGLVSVGPTNTAVSTPPHAVTNSFGPFGNMALFLPEARAWILTNQPSPTNLLVEGVFVQAADTNINVDVRFAPSSIPTNLFHTAVVELSTSQTNVLTGANILATLYVLDRIAAETNFVILTNLQSQTTFMPSPFEVTRITPFEFLIGSQSNVVMTNNFFAQDPITQMSYSNDTPVHAYAAYSFTATNVAPRVPQVPGATLTNTPGRLEIYADTLDLEKTRMRGEGLIRIGADNLLSTRGAVFDVQTIALDLKSRQSELQLEGVPSFVERFVGPVRVWSAVWTNTFESTVTNTAPDPNDPNTMVDTVVTNAVEVGFHAFVLDVDALRTRVPVVMPEFRVEAAKVVIDHDVRAEEAAEVIAESLTIRTNRLFSLGSALNNWDSAKFPRLKILENDGLISIFNRGQFGSGRAIPYVLIVNRGTNTAFSHSISTFDFENRGRFQTDFSLGGTFSLTAHSAVLAGTTLSNEVVNGQIVAGGDVTIRANNLVLRDHALSSGHRLFLSVTNSIDNSMGTNLFQSQAIHLLHKPPVGDFLNSQIMLNGPIFALVPHVWAGEDRGPTTTGFANNAAVGHLVLNGQFDTLHSFSGASVNNALYVEFLEIGGALTNDVESALEIAPNMRIYFADSNLPAEQLDGLFDGRLQWVPEFAGARSSVEVMEFNETDGTFASVAMNRSLRESSTIDTDGDGTVNADDEFPLDNPDPAEGPSSNVFFRIRVEGFQVDSGSAVFSFSWVAEPQASYRVDYATDLIRPDWKTLQTYENSSAASSTITVRDPGSAEGGKRFYRVLLNP